MTKKEWAEIHTVTPVPGSDRANIAVDAKGQVDTKGDIWLVAAANGAEATIKLKDSVDGHYRLKQGTGENAPICVYKVEPGVSSCLPGAMPTGWTYTGGTTKKVTLNIPDFPPAEKYEYMLFLTNSKTNPATTMIVDPQIGCCMASYDKTHDVLILLAVAVAAALFGYGVRVFQGSRKQQ